MAKDQPKFLAVLPWLRLAEEIEVGPFTFWRWPEDSGKHIQSQEMEQVKASLDANFRDLRMEKKRWILQNLEFESLCFISHKGKGTLFVRGSFEDILLDMQIAIDILCACTLFQIDIDRNPTQRRGFASVNRRYYRSQADFAFKIIPLDPNVGLKFIKRSYGYDESNEFPPIPMIRPRECTDNKIGARDSLLVSLANLLTASRKDVHQRIFRAIAHFNSAFVDTIPAIPFPKVLEGYFYKDVVTVATAFEILLNIYNIHSEKKKEELGKRISKLFIRNTVIPEPTKNKSWKVFWIESFYGLRNGIVHGKEIPFKSLEWPNNPYAGLHTEVAIKVFRLALMKTLVKEHLHTETDEDTWQANKLDEWLSTEMKRFPSASDTDFALWSVAKELKAKDDA